MVSNNVAQAWQASVELEHVSETRRALRQLSRRKSAMVGMGLIIALILTAVFAPLLETHDPLSGEIRDRFQPPSREHYFGTDFLGRDVFSRVIAGAVISIQVGLFPVLIGLSIGFFFGIVAGYFGGRVGTVIMGIVDVMLAFPGILLALGIVSILGVGLTNVMIAVGIGLSPHFARQVRAEALSLRERDFILASWAIGSSDLHVIKRHLLPNVVPTIIIQMTLSMATALLAAAGLSFLGLGAQPPTPEWGAMLADGRQYLRNEWWIATFPGIAIFLTILGINLLGDGVRDALDPRLRR